LLKLPQPNGWGISLCASSELKSAEAEKSSASHNLTIGKFREGGLKNMPVQQLEVLERRPAIEFVPPKVVEFVVAEPKPFLTPIGERLVDDEAIPYREFFPAALPPDVTHLADFCSDLMTELASQLNHFSKQTHIILSLRGSCVRRACWNLVTERNGYPVGDYWSISPWWKNFFSLISPSSSYSLLEEKVKRILTTGPKDLDPRLEYVLTRHRKLFADFVCQDLPKIIEEVRLKHGSLGLNIDHNHFVEGVDPFINLPDTTSTYVGSHFHLYDGRAERPIFTLDHGTANLGRDGIYTAHGIGEPHLLMGKNGVFLPPFSQYNRKILTNLFLGGQNASLYSAFHGLKGSDILCCGSRQIYFGAFYDPANLPVFDPTILAVIHKLKMKHQITNEQRVPEIVANLIVGLMTDPIYSFTCLRLADYFRQFTNLQWLADDAAAQSKMEEVIQMRMTNEFFQGGVWDPFIIIDAYNEIAPNPVEKSFSSLVRLLTS